MLPRERVRKKSIALPSIRCCRILPSAVAVLGLALLGAPPRPGAAQSLGEVAKQEREKREKAQKEGKAKPRTLTEADLKAAGRTGGLSVVSASPTPTGGPGTGPRSPGASVSQDRTDDTHRDQEAHWRSRAQQARAQMEKARRRVEVLQELWLAPGEVYVDESGKVLVGSIGELQQLTTRAKAELAEAEKALERLEDEARRAGIPPGWLRD